jgi:hypothetical protein
MVLALTSCCQRDRIKNPRDYDWHSTMSTHDPSAAGKICKFELMNRFTDIDVLVKGVADCGSEFVIEGGFLDLDSENDSGNWYRFFVTFVKAADTAEIVFEPCRSREYFYNSDHYEKHRRKSFAPSA